MSLAVVARGVSGGDKSSVGEGLAERVGAAFLDADERAHTLDGAPPTGELVTSLLKALP